MGLASGAVAAVIVALGIRSLSGDYLIRVSGMVHGGPAAGARVRRSRMGEIVARLCGGQAARAGFAFVSRMMQRDWQFRRQALMMHIGTLAILAQTVWLGWRTDPFSGHFTRMHLLPHLLGLWLFFVCSILAYGADYRGAWIFLLAPAQAFGPFARGVHALLWISLVGVPHAIVLPLLVWRWGAPHAALFVAYSGAAASLYLALELRLIEGAPFSKQVDPSRGAMLMPLMILGGLAMAAAVELQYFLVFRSTAIVAAATLVVGVAAYLLTKRSLRAFEESIRFHLGLLSMEAGTLYKEVDL